MFVDDDGKGLVPTGNVDSESVVEVVFDETANLMASMSFKGGSDRGYGTNILLEQLREIKWDDDYDPYDDDLYERHDMSDHLQNAIYASVYSSFASSSSSLSSSSYGSSYKLDFPLPPPLVDELLTLD
ncbi:hypothetical protein Tco_0102347 [Tanacetum coccineum]